MLGKLCVNRDQTFVWIRFESVGRRGRFNIVLEKFRNAFPLAVWDEHYKAWCLPSSQFTKIVAFGEDLFGAQGVEIRQWNNSATVPHQTTLF